MVGRDVPGAPRPRERTRGRHRVRGPRPRGRHRGRQRVRGPRPRERTRERHVYAGRRGRRPLPCTAPRHVRTPAPRPHPRTTSAPPRHVRTHGRARRPRRAVSTGTPTGTPTGMRAAEDVGPYHVSPPSASRATSAPPYHVRTHGRARRPRRAAPTGTPTGTPRVHGPPGTSAPTMYRATQRPCPAPRPHPRATSAPMVGRDVPGAPRPRERQRGHPQARGPRPRGRQRGRHRVRGPPGTSAPTMYHPRPHPASCPHPMVGRRRGGPHRADASVRAGPATRSA